MKKVTFRVRRFYIFCVCVTVFSLVVGASFSSLSGALAKTAGQKNIIKWVDFRVTYEALSDCLDYDVKNYKEPHHAGMVSLLACLACQNGGDFSHYKRTQLTKITDALQAGKTIEELCARYKNYDYFYEAYSAVLGGFVGEYDLLKTDENGETKKETHYGLKAFSPIAKGYSYSHSDDFGVSRSYGFRRKHLGHDMFGSVGTPVYAVESGTVEALGWNQYGGWRIGIRSFDRKRYYYYAHLRKDHPYHDMYEGKVVTAGDVIGYLGMTGYSTKENVNNINTPHLHYGLQLIFDEETQKDGTNQIWIDLYAITKLLEKNRSAVTWDGEQKEYFRKYEMFIPETED